MLISRLANKNRSPNEGAPDREIGYWLLTDSSSSLLQKGTGGWFDYITNGKNWQTALNVSGVNGVSTEQSTT